MRLIAASTSRSAAVGLVDGAGFAGVDPAAAFLAAMISAMVMVGLLIFIYPTIQRVFFFAVCN
jgi:hypothetical protein